MNMRINDLLGGALILVALFLLGIAYGVMLKEQARPVDCLSEGLSVTYERLEGVRPGDPDYEDAVRWSSICPEWGVGGGHE